jgi:hypothetical protein
MRGPRGLGFALTLLTFAGGCALSHERGVDAATDVGRPPPGILGRCSTDIAGPSRDCGWDRSSSFSCSPGAMVEVACGAGCRLGSCMGDAMIRVCAGEAECSSSMSLGQDDDSCGSLCPRTMIRCPAGGRFTVLTAPFGSSGSYSCSVAIR